jgi:hypothetical protein
MASSECRTLLLIKASRLCPLTQQRFRSRALTSMHSWWVHRILPLFKFDNAPPRLVLDLRSGLNELAPVKHQVSPSWLGEHKLNNIHSALYGIVHQQYDTIERTLDTCLGEIMDSRQIPPVSKNVVRIVIFPEIFGAIIGLINEHVLHFSTL